MKKNVHPKWKYPQKMFTLLAVCLMCLLPSTLVAQKITVHVEQGTLDQAFQQIMKSSDVEIVYNTAQAAAVPCDEATFTNQEVAEILNVLLRGTALQFRVENGIYMIVEKQEERRPADGKITGRIVDKDGNPLPGVTVFIKGTYMGTATGNDGSFVISHVPDSVVTVVASCVGMKTQELQAKLGDHLEIRMEVQVNEMDEVLITGFQVLKKREATSSIYTLNAEDIIEPVGTSIDQMLQGKVPGMSVMQMTSTVGAAPKIRIRGSSTIIGNREPVWVLDGVVLQDPVPLDPAELNSMDRVNLIGNAISGLNPEDIERIDVLKDASATALYGTKAANGVIVITTKRGKVGTPTIRYSTSMSFVERPSYDGLFVMNSAERIEVSEEIYRRGLEFVGFSPTNAGFEGAVYQLRNGLIDQKQFSDEVHKMKEMNTDWFDLLFRNSFSHQHTFSVSGGSENATYYFSAGYSNQRGASMKENSERFSFMSNLDFKINERFRVSAQLGASMNTTKRPMVDLFEYAYTTSRAIPAYNEDGSLFFYDYEAGYGDGLNKTIPLTFNIFNELHYSGSETKIKTINTNINLDYKLASWLSLGAVLSYNSSSTTSESWYDERTYHVSTYRMLPYGYDRNTLTSLDNYLKTWCRIPYGGILNTSSNGGESFTGRFSLNINKSFHDIHSLSLLAGLDVQSQKSTGVEREEWGYLLERGKNFVELDAHDSFPLAEFEMANLKPTMTDATSNTLSYYASFSYAYKGKYVMSANVRGDGSNKLGEQARFLPVYSVSARWNMTDEPFMHSLLDVVPNLGLRISYGIQANVTDAHNPNMVISIGSLDMKSEEYYSVLSSLPNRGLKWEKTNSFNVGVDFDLFKGKLSGTFDYWYKKSKDQLMNLEVTSTNGGKSVTINGGDLVNKGWDLALSTTPVRTDNFTWNVTFNTSKAYNEVLTTANQSVTYSEYLNGSLVRDGFALNSFYSYRFAGLDENGIPMWYGLEDHDENGNVTVTTQEQAFESALVYSGRREPKISGGISMGFSYKNFSLNSTFSMQFGSKIRLNDLYQGDDFKLPYPGQNMNSDFVNRWRKPGDEKHTNIPALTDEYYSVRGEYADINKTSIMDNVSSNYWQMYNNADMRVVSGNFMRCNSLSLSYSFGESVVKKLRLRSLYMSLGVSNPFVIKAKGLQGRDPEQLTMGSGTIPPQQTYSFSLNVTF